MRVAAAFLLLALAGCREKQADPKAVVACMSAQHSHDDYLLVTRCEPLEKSERFAGTWLVGFETSLFKEGRASGGSSLGEYHDLIVPAPINQAVHKPDGPGYAAYDIVFVGRRSLLEPKSEPSAFVADRIVSMRRAQVQPQLAR